ncbi:MAG TPA: hypothetical protein PKK10_18435 [Woeseiaceae bacterium]|nr:hypothetical protein [Woeseiaceae bacterium]
MHSEQPRREPNPISGLLITALLLAALGLAAALPLFADEATCGSLDNAYGPFDYTNADHRANRIPIVEEGHFNDDVRALRRGVTSDSPGPDLDYTLRAVPNYHDALYAMARYSLQSGNDQPEGSRYSVDCWFDRAERFAPYDGVVNLIYGIYLHKKKQYPQAEQQYLAAIPKMETTAEVHYNLGLLYLDMGRIDDAGEQAELAYAQGYPLPGLRMKLARLSKNRSE